MNSKPSPGIWSRTHAVVSPVDLHVLGGAHAGVVAQGVVAGARATDPDVGRALVDVCGIKESKHWARVGKGMGWGGGRLGTRDGWVWHRDRFVMRKSGRERTVPGTAGMHTQLWHTCVPYTTDTQPLQQVPPLCPAPGAGTFADAGVLVQVVAQGTLALEAAEGVDAVPALAQPRQLLALVDV